MAPPDHDTDGAAAVPVPSFGCLLYLAADEVVRARRWRREAEVPCGQTRVHAIELSATILAATFIELRDAGSLEMRLGLRGRLLKVSRLKVAKAQGLPRVAQRAVGSVAAEGHRLYIINIVSRMIKLSFGQVPFWESARLLAYQELAALGYLTGGELDCGRIALLQQPCQDAVRRWQQLRQTEALLVRKLMRECRGGMQSPGGAG